MSDKEKANMLILVANVIGALCVISFGILYITHNTSLINLDTMVPMQKWEFSGIMLAICLLPLMVANILMYMNSKIKNKYLRYLLFLPSFLCLLIVVDYILVAI